MTYNGIRQQPRTPQPRQTGPRYLPLIAGIASALVALLVVGVVALGRNIPTAAPAATTSAPTGPTSTPTPTKPRITKNATYVDAKALYDAAVAVGYHAGRWKPDATAKANSLSSGSEGEDGASFYVYNDGETLRGDLNQIHAGDNAEYMLVGPNWMIVAEDLTVLQDRLGGEHPTWAAKKTPAPAPKQKTQVPTPKPKQTQAPKPKPMTESQEQAVGTAEDYLDYTHFSKKGLIKQLKHEGFSTKEAEFAVEHIKVSWKEQAAGAAEDYLDYSHFSRPGLIRQLEYEGYTRAQAEYGVKKAFG